MSRIYVKYKNKTLEKNATIKEKERGKKWK